MPHLHIPVRHIWGHCPEGRLVVRPHQAEGSDDLPPSDDDNARLLGDEVQIGVWGEDFIVLDLRDEVKPSVFQRIIEVREKSELWIGSSMGSDDAQRPSGIMLAAPMGRYLLSGWFDQIRGGPVTHLVLGLRPLQQK